MGFEWQHVKFSTLQPPWSRGEFDYNGDYTDIPNVNGGSTGRADFLLTPCAAGTAGPCAGVTGGPNGIPNVGGSSEVFVSNISLTDNGKDYYGSFINDDWKLTPKLTVNLGLRWDFFGLVGEHHEIQANFSPVAPPTGAPVYIIPPGKNSGNVSSGCPKCFTNLLATDGIHFTVTNQYAQGLGHSRKTNFAPRIGLAYLVTPKLVARAGFGLFYNGFENRGFSPNLGENYPFQFNFSFSSPNDATPISAGTPFAGCAATAPYGGTATFEAGFACTPLSPLLVTDA